MIGDDDDRAPTFDARSSRTGRLKEAVTIHRKGVCVTLRVHGGFEWKHSRSQQLNACATIHGALKCLEAIDLSLGLAAAPMFHDGVPDGLDISAQRSRKLLY